MGDREYLEERAANGNRLFVIRTDRDPKTVYEEMEPDYTGLGSGASRRTGRRYDTERGRFV
jgi:hypothetical protein